MTILEIAEYNLAVAKDNLALRRAKPKENAFWDLDVVSGEEDIAKWERVVSRLQEINREPQRT